VDGSLVFARLRQCASPSNACYLAPTRVHTPNGISIGSAVFAQIMAECPYAVQWAANSHSKLPLRMGTLDPPSNTCFLGPIPLSIPNGIPSGSAVFAQFTTDSKTLPHKCHIRGQDISCGLNLYLAAKVKILSLQYFVNIQRNMFSLHSIFFQNNIFLYVT